MPPPLERGPLFSLLEYAPDYIVHALHIPYWIWLAFRYQGLTLPSIADPAILVGGIAGESKAGLFALVGPEGRKYFAPFITVIADVSINEIVGRLGTAGLAFPLVAKPDIGRNGLGVKIVRTAEELGRHLGLFPPTTRMILQQYVSAEGEAGVFYVRRPSEARGRITSLTLKYFPRVVGDGRVTLRELIERDPRASRIKNIYFRRNRRELDRVVPVGEPYRLVSVGNHVRGAVFEDGAAQITEAMTDAFDGIAKDMREFYFGRFDVRFSHLEDLKRGTGFTILEYNGASSEPTHVWDRRTSVVATYRALLEHWRLAFLIGAENRARGFRPASLREILKIHYAECDLVDQYPDEE
ncbi:D-alanine--D-alanine ligase [Candidatus Kaiserbacteria bacterium]|nr:D-alanine--D-alanine ligase [Candidatus Kaiserbacteria bacterium]